MSEYRGFQIPLALALDTNIAPRSKLIYGLINWLQTQQSATSIQIQNREIGRQLCIGENPVADSLSELHDALWIERTGNGQARRIFALRAMPEFPPTTAAPPRRILSPAQIQDIINAVKRGLET